VHGAKVAPEEFVQLLEEFFEMAAQEQQLASRMAFARTTVAIHLTDAPEGTGATLHLTQMPISATAGIDPSAEIHMYAPTPLWIDMLADRIPLPMAVHHGDVEYSGPVRKFLRVAPILRGFDYDMWRGKLGPAAGTEVPNPGMDAAAGTS
jgi:hypothetical protein